MDMTTSHQLRTDLEGYDKWKFVTPRHPEVKIGDKNKNKMEKVFECTIEQTLISKNSYVALKNQKIQLKRFAKEDNENYSVPKIINQQLSSEKIRKLQIQE